MSVKAKLIIDEHEINVLSFSYKFNKGFDYGGRPSQKTIFIGLDLVIETRKELNLADWAFANNQIKQIELHILPIVLGRGKTRKIHFYDCHLVSWINDFCSTGTQPMSETLRITAAGFTDSKSSGEYSASWRTTYPEQTNTEVTVREDPIDQTPDVIEYYLTNFQGKKVTELKIGDKLYLIVKTKNLIGKSLTINLNNKNVDFLYDDDVLPNDTLSDYEINNDLEKIPLEITYQGA